VARDSLVGTLVRVQPTTPIQTGDLARHFSVGQTLKGVVLRALPEGQMLVNFGGQHVVLDLGHALGRGQTFLATVEQTTPALVLKVLNEGSDVTPPAATVVGHQPAPAAATPHDTATAPLVLSAARLKPYVVAKQPFGDMIATLQQHLLAHPLLPEVDATLHRRLTTTLAALLPPEAPLPDAAMLQEQVDRSGINYEAKVADFLSKPAVSSDQAALTQDLKGQLLALLSRLDQLSTPHEDVSALRQQAQQALQTIEFQQLANLFAQQEHQALLLQFMHPSLATSHTAQLYFRVDPGDAGTPPAESWGYTLVFLLDFTSLGQIRIDAVVRQAQITATIRTTAAAVAEFISTHTPALRARLQALGYQAEVRCRAQEAVSLEVEDTFSRLLMAESSRLLDVLT
jgi:hypothetical protein